MSRRRGPDLGTFLTDLRARLNGLSHDDLVQVLVEHAQRLPAGERDAFLGIFRAPPAPPGGQGAEDLPLRVREFAHRVASGEFYETDDGEIWNGGYGWDDEEPVPTWVADADALFAQASELFLTGTPKQALEVYELLLALFRADRTKAPGTDETWPDEALEFWSLQDTDVAEVLARYVRCTYETAAAEERSSVVRDVWSSLPWSPVPLALVQVIGARPDPLPDLDAFLPGWIDALVDDAGWPAQRDRVRLLAEAAWLHHGLDSLADIVARPGPHLGGISRIMVDALDSASRPHDAAKAAREALGLPDLEPGLRAGIADRLADLHVVLADLPAAVQARQEAWRARPTRRRLLALVEDAGVGDPAGAVLQAEAARVLAAAGERGAPVDRFGCELLLVAGRWEAAVEALRAASPLGWSRAEHPGPVVLPYLWVAATGVPADRPVAGQLRVAFSAIDDLPDDPAYERLLTGSSSADESGPWAGAGAAEDQTERPLLTTLLAAGVARDVTFPAHSDELLAVAGRVTDARTEAIVSTKHRGAYARAAALVLAHAEALSARSPGSGTAYLAGVRARYPRHVAFRRELDLCAKRSTLV